MDQLLSRFDPLTGEIEGAPTLRRHLSDLRGCFVDGSSFESALRAGNPLLYTVACCEPDSGPGDLHYGIGRLMPGQIGSEYYLTKGHYHSWREAAELYIGLTGEGMMLLQDESSGESRIVPLKPYQAVYVPGHTAHRTINTGSSPLTYLGIYPSKAGHDYASIGERNFAKVLIERNGQPLLLDRAEWVRTNSASEIQKENP